MYLKLTQKQENLLLLSESTKHMHNLDTYLYFTCNLFKKLDYFLDFTTIVLNTRPNKRLSDD